MLRRVTRFSVLLAVAIAACSEPTATNSLLTPDAGPSKVVTSSQGTMTIVQGQGHYAEVSTFVGVASANSSGGGDPAIQLLDLNGQPIANEPVTFTASSSTARVGIGADPTTTTYTATTNSSGVAIVRWKLGSAVGGQTLTATAGTGGVSVTFHAIAISVGGGAPVIVELQGDQTGSVNEGQMAGHPVFYNPTVVVRDGNATALPNVPVGFVPSGNGSANPNYVLTNAAGQVSTQWRLATTAGAQTLIARLAFRAGISTTFTVTAVTQGVSMTKIRGDGGTAVAIAGTRFGPKDLAVQILNASGTGVSGAAVRFTFGVGVTDCGLILAGGTKIVFTDSDGIARTSACTSTTTAGSRTVTAAAGDFVQTFTLTVTANTATSAVTCAQPTTCAYGSRTVGTTLTPDAIVRVADANGNALAGVQVTFDPSGSGTACNLSNCGGIIVVTTDANGQAGVRWTLGTAAGAQTLTATASSGGVATFTATATAGTATTILKLGGDNQTAPAGTATPKAPTVQIVDQYGNPVSGVGVGFSPSGNGTVSPNFVTTGSDGRAATVWTLSTTPGTNTLTVTTTVGLSTTFTATGT